MSVKTTHTIERNTAIGIIIQNMNIITDKELANMLECFEDVSIFRNYKISEEEIEEYSMPHITTEMDFFI